MIDQQSPGPGGPRPGSGRPPELENAVKRCAWIPGPLDQRVSDLVAAGKATNKADAIRRALEAWAGRFG